MSNEYRGVWISFLDWGLLDTGGRQAFCESAKRLFSRCREIGINRAIVQVRPFCDAIYKSRLFPPSHVLAGVQGNVPDFDPLEEIIAVARDFDIGVEAWINPYRVRLNRQYPPGELSKQSPALLHPSWVKSCGEGLYLDPALPEVIQFITEGVREVVKNYDIAAVQFDDYFYPTTGSEFDIDSFKKYGGGQPLSSWRRENVNRLVRKVYAIIKELKPGVGFGISPQGNNAINFNEQYSDCAKWLREPGYVDYLMPQLYWGFDYVTKDGDESFSFKNAVDSWLAMPKDGAVSLLFGLGAYRVDVGDGSAKKSGEWQSGENLSLMVNCLYEKNSAGYALFRAENLFSDSPSSTMQSELKHLKGFF